MILSVSVRNMTSNLHLMVISFAIIENMVIKLMIARELIISEIDSINEALEIIITRREYSLLMYSFKLLTDLFGIIGNCPDTGIK